MTALSKEPYISQSRWQYKSIWIDPIQFTKVIGTVHGRDCRPCAQNRVATQQRSGTCKLFGPVFNFFSLIGSSFIYYCPGKYVAQYLDEYLFTLVNMLDQNGRLPSSATIISIVQPAWPNQKDVSKHDCFNIKVKLLKLRSGMHESYTCFS